MSLSSPFSMPSTANHPPFYAFSYFYDRFVEEASVTPNVVTSLSTLSALASEACTLAPSDLKAKYHSDESDYSNQCKDLTYLTTLLTSGYDFSTTNDSVVFAKKIDGVETAWCLGAVLDIFS